MRPVVVCGIPRSGSTLVGQIVQGVFPDQKVLKTHPAYTEWNPTGCDILITIRDPRDVIASLYRVHLSQTGKTEVEGADFDQIFVRVQKHYDMLWPLLEENSIIIRYEDFVYNYYEIYAAIFLLTGVSVSCTMKEWLNNKFSIESNRARASVLKNFNEVGEHEIHGDHVGPVKPGSWRTSLPEWIVKDVESFCSPIMRSWSYKED